jgi:hypothetical protein
VKLLEFARSTILFRIDLDLLPPRTLSHKPPFAMNNARIQIDSVCRITERAGGRRYTFILGGDCKTERVGAERDLFLDPNADFIPIFSDDAFMHIKTFARAGTQAQAYPPGSGEQSDRLTAKIADTFVDATSTSSSAGATAGRRGAIVEAILPTTSSSASTASAPIATTSRSSTRPRRSTQRARHRLPDRHRPDPVARPRARSGRPADRSRARLAATYDAARLEARSRVDTESWRVICDAPCDRSIRVEGIANEFYRLPDSAPAIPRRVDLLAGA